AADGLHFRALWMVAGYLRRQASSDSECHAAAAAFLGALPETVRAARALQLRPADCQEDDQVLEAAVLEAGRCADEVRAAVLRLWRIQTASKMCAVRSLVRFLSAAGHVAPEDLHGRHTGGSTQVIACVWVLEALSEFGLIYSDEFELILSSVPLQPWAGIVGQLFSRLGESNRSVTRCLTVLLARLAGEYPQLVVYPYVVKSGCVDDASLSNDLVGETLEKRFHALFESSCSLVGDLLAVACTPRERWWHALVSWCARVSRPVLDDEAREQLFAPLAGEAQSLLNSVGFPLRGDDGSALLASLRSIDAANEAAVRKQLSKLRAAMSPEPGPVAVAELCNGRTLFAGSSAAPMPGRSMYAPAASETVVTVASWAPQVTVLASKTRPKKIELIGSDGLSYQFLLKASEDLRLDARVMEWLRACNRMFRGRRDTRALEFHACAYAVLPLGERVGLIEWVDDVQPLFSVVAATDRPLEAYYAELGKRGGGEDGAAAIASGRRRRATPEDLRAVYDALKRSQPDDVLARYLWSVSRTSSDWLAKVATYRSTLAVMSMVGHVLGLGDRHLDNILIRPRTGEVVHIDFNVCFDKGRRLLVPELVPFRLTRNLERALGPARSAGAFHRCCVRALEVLRENRSALVTLLSAFLYSPLSDWRAAASVERAASVRPLRNTTAVEAVQGVRAKLADDRPLERYVTALIEQATDDLNLAQMFEGWMAWV
ncbi:MAG TPA: PIKK family serine/threonine-protein kinase, partial [archaeon]|nr:PIKK family serine/threonine-protein kinase [archaeon]